MSKPKQGVYVGLLRGVNVGGHKSVAMSDLRDLGVALGFDDVRTVLQSGNFVFRSASKPSRDLETLCERAAKKHLGLDTAFHVRTADEWQAAIAANPFTEEAARDPGRLLLVLLKDQPRQADVIALERAIVGRELVRAGERHAYIVFPDGVGRSKLTTALLDRTLGKGGTGRNWNTVLRLDALARELAARRP
jgi:uncharacterized protein (DUF1697 family)